MASLAEKAKGALASNRREAISLSQTQGLKKTKALLEESARELEKRLRRADLLRGDGEETFTRAQMRVTLRQLQFVIRDLTLGLKDNLLEQGAKTAEQSAQHTVDYLAAADKAFRGIGTQPLALKEASMLSEAVKGTQSTILRRLMSSGEPIEGADEVPHPAKMGVLQRYGVETIGFFEESLQKGLLQKKSWAQMRDDLTEQSPFLQAAPAHWAQRIVRTELSAVYNRAGWEATRDADEQLGDMTKILSAVFDERTAADSYSTHGQIRRPEEAFETWYGLLQHPPDRPNDRGIVVPHRISWPIPPYLAWRTEEEIVKAWLRDKRKGRPPERPLMTTVPLALFGKEQPPKLSEKGEEEAPDDSE